MKIVLLSCVLLLTSFSNLFALKDDEPRIEALINSGLVSGLSFRNIGPAVASGRIGDIAVNPNNSSEYYLAVASGGVWKTTNHGNTYYPIFDNEVRIQLDA